MAAQQRIPVVATTVAPPATGALARLSVREASFVRGMKRKDRTALVRVLTEDTKRQKSALETPLRLQVLQSPLPEAVRLRVFEDLARCGSDKLVEWVRRALRLPLGVRAPRAVPGAAAGEAVARARALMDAEVTGHERTKREVLKLVCQDAAGGGGGAYALGLEGPPGTGKTHFVRNALAPALGRPMVSIPLGGACDISYLLGNVYTYEGSKEGRLASALVEAGCSDPILFFDEVDKISATDRGQELASVLIHLTDPTANTALRDRYFHGIDLDFSKCTIVFGFNDARRVSPILLDRIRRIPVAAPTEAQRAEIVRAHLVPRAQKRLNTAVALSEGAVDKVLRLCASEQGGLREAERGVDHVLSCAQLCCECGGDGTIVGAPDVEALEDQEVTARFAERVLLDADVGLRGNAPPLGMYT